MKSAAGGQLASDIGHLAESLNPPRSLFEPASNIPNNSPSTSKSFFSLKLLEGFPFILKKEVLCSRLFFSPFYSVKKIGKNQAIPT
jgi:hypothetical protein